MKYHLFLSDLMKLCLSLQIWEKYSIWKFIKIRPVGAELFHADGRTDITKQTVAFRNFAKAPKKWEWAMHSRHVAQASWYTPYPPWSFHMTLTVIPLPRGTDIPHIPKQLSTDFLRSRPLKRKLVSATCFLFFSKFYFLFRLVRRNKVQSVEFLILGAFA
jgi:hypothetical protein